MNLCNGKSKFFVNLVEGRPTNINERDIPDHVMSNGISVLSYFHRDVYRFATLCIGMHFLNLSQLLSLGSYYLLLKKSWEDFDMDFLSNWVQISSFSSLVRPRFSWIFLLLLFLTSKSDLCMCLNFPKPLPFMCPKKEKTQFWFVWLKNLSL